MTQKKSKTDIVTKPRIMQVVPSLISGGVERGTIDVTKHLYDHGWQPLVASSGGQLVEKVIEYGGEHIKLKANSKNPYTIWKNIDKIAGLIDSQKIDLVHVRSRAPAWSCYYATQKTNTPLITTFHGIYSFNSNLKHKYNNIMTKGDVVIAVSNFVQNHLLENYDIEESKIRVIHRGIDTDYFSNQAINEKKLNDYKIKYHIPLDVPIILLPARITKWKGPEILIDALNLLKDKDVYCIIVGDMSKHPNYAKRLNDKIRELKLQRKLRIFGADYDIRYVYALADIVLSTSIEPEAFGRTIVEALSMEKLTIATNIGGATETIQNGVNGFHVRPGREGELADKIRYAIDNLYSSEFDNIRKNARDSVVKNFSLPTMLSKTMDIYKELL